MTAKKPVKKKRKTTKCTDDDVMEFYRVFPTCPYCEYQNELESEIGLPDHATCQSCNKVFNIKYVD